MSMSLDAYISGAHVPAHSNVSVVFCVGPRLGVVFHVRSGLRMGYWQKSMGPGTGLCGKH
jgi:hypothetical protein